jgi:hypothetical protein
MEVGALWVRAGRSMYMRQLEEVGRVGCEDDNDWLLLLEWRLRLIQWSLEWDDNGNK